MRALPVFVIFLLFSGVNRIEGSTEREALEYFVTEEPNVESSDYEDFPMIRRNALVFSWEAPFNNLREAAILQEARRLIIFEKKQIEENRKILQNIGK